MLSDIEVLAALGFQDAPMLGSGGEAQVYALGTDRVARVMRPGATHHDADARAEMLRQIAAHATHLPYRTPEVLAVHNVEDRIAVIEPRLPGTPVSALLQTSSGETRVRLIESYLETAASISTITLPVTAFGPVMEGTPFRASDWQGFSAARLRWSAERCPDDLHDAVKAQADTIMAEPLRPSLVHLDYFPGNVLAEADRITAVLDFGPSAIIGDARLEVWSAVAYLDAELSPAATDADRTQAMAWLERHRLDGGFAEARRWLAAYWAFATDDAAVMAWCRRILLG